MLHYASNLDPQIQMAFTTQAEGNLALHVNDDPQQVRENRAQLEKRIGVRAFSLRFMNQTHSVSVQQVTEDPAVDATRVPAPNCDGMISARAAAPLAVMVADCLPVLFVGRDARTGEIATAAVHAGRRGLLEGILPETVRQLSALGATGIEAVIGPAICGSCYEVPEQMRAESERLLPGIGGETSWGTPALNLPDAALRQLEALGVGVRNSEQCTLENPEYFSHRRSHSSGRIAGVIWKNPEGPATHRSLDTDLRR